MSCMQQSLRNFLYEALKRFCNENPSNTILFFLNINSICYKFEDLKFFCMDIMDILFRGETKLHSSFPYSRVLLKATINHLH